MSEELKQEVQEKQTDKAPEASAPSQEKEYSPLERQALEQGWKPQEEWEGDPNEWRDARSFLDRGELLTRISQQSKEMKELRKTLKAFEDLNKKLAETKFVEKLDSLKVAKKEALEAGDAARVVELDEQIDLVKDSIAENKASEIVRDAAPEVPPEFQRWVEKNSWYAHNDEMRMFADNVGTSFARMNRDKSPAEVLKYVEARVKKAYSDMFENPARSAPSKVADSSVRGAARSKMADREAELPDEARQVMNTLVRSGTMTKEEYMKQYFLTK